MRGYLVFAGFTAVLGGVLRVLSSFFPVEDPTSGTEVFYALIDLLLLFGLIGIFIRTAHRTGPFGLVGFIIAVAGAASLVGPESDLFGFDFYMMGAAIMLVGLGIIGILLCMNAQPFRLAGIFWIVAFVFALLSLATPSSLTSLLAGIAAGAGFVAAGLTLLLSPSTSRFEVNY